MVRKTHPLLPAPRARKRGWYIVLAAGVLGVFVFCGIVIAAAGNTGSPSRTEDMSRNGALAAPISESAAAAPSPATAVLPPTTAARGQHRGARGRHGGDRGRHGGDRTRREYRAHDGGWGADHEGPYHQAADYQAAGDEAGDRSHGDPTRARANAGHGGVAKAAVAPEPMRSTTVVAGAASPRPPSGAMPAPSAPPLPCVTVAPAISVPWPQCGA
ncbi:hypothetical protein [Dactylosporangium salmoneum]